MPISEKHRPETYWLLEDLGQMGNKLVLFAHLAALCMSTGGKVYFPSFAPHAEHFRNFAGQIVPQYSPQLPSRPKGNKWDKAKVMCFNLLFRTIRKLKIRKFRAGGVSYEWVETDGVTVKSDIDLSTLTLQRPDELEKVYGLFGWRFRNQQQFERFEERLIELFALNDSLRVSAERRIEEIKIQMPRSTQIVGLHIRGGDYKNEFLGSRYVPPDQAMDLAARYANRSRRPCHIIIFSNEQIRIPCAYKDLMSLGPGAQMEDFATLACCDKIVAPMSTFSAFASFLGQVPLVEINAQSEEILEDEFSVVRYFGPRPSDN